MAAIVTSRTSIIGGEAADPPSPKSVTLLIEYANAYKAFQLSCLLVDQFHFNCIFLYGKGVHNINDPEWQALAKKHEIPFLACINSLEKEKINCCNSHIAGLSTFITYALESDHTFQIKSDEDIHLNYH